jgi:caffeoyl-CoA O-methyltransferase
VHTKYTALDPRLYDYLLAHCSPPSAVETDLIAETERLGGLALMQVSPEEGMLLRMAVQLCGARSAVEVGTFTGYSALAIAGGLPDDGRLLCCDVNVEWTAIGRRYWERAGVAHKIELVIAPALDTLRSLPADARFDFAFIDADKTNYLAYYEEILYRMPVGGVIAVDNVLWMGRVADPAARDDDTEAIRRFNDFVVADPRVEVVVLPVSDGISLIRKVK